MKYPSGPLWILYPVVVFIVTLIWTWCLCIYALRYKLLDMPTERSSHVRPTPRGGGLAIVLSMLIFLAFLYHLELITLGVLLALAGGGLIVAIIGWLDDHYDISPLVRGLIYAFAAIWTVYFLNGLRSVGLGEYSLELPVYGNLLAVLGLFWLLNLYNFMDGTDALAAIQAVCTGIFLGLLFQHTGEQPFADISFAMAAAAAGFLCWNWPPAKIFMGDAGSCFIGLTFGGLGILAEKTDSVSVYMFYLLLAVFICDATLTLAMRMVKREKWYMPHRSHAYQRLAQMGVSHRTLALGLLGINLFLLWPMAFIAFYWPQLSWLVVSLITIILCLAWTYVQIRYQRYCVPAG